eukprot:5955242-Pleurochrysis_carterae.AAC.1
MYVRRGASRVHGQSTGGRRRCPGSCDVPFVKPTAAQEWESTACAVRTRGELHCAGAGETAVDAGGRPQLSDRK